MPIPQDPSQVTKAAPKTAAPARKFTNVPGKGDDWMYFENFETPRELTPEEKTRIRGSGERVSPSVGIDFAKGWEENPVLGSRPQGTWDYETIKRNFPGMFDERMIKQEDFERMQQREQEIRQDSRLQGFEDMPQMLDRDRFEQNVFSTLGGNPFAIDPVAEMNAATQELPKVFEQAFGGKIAWVDRGKLNKNQREFWEDVKKQFRAHVYDTVKSKRQSAIDQYNVVMNRFDYYEKTRQSIYNQQEAKRKETEKAPERIQARGADGLKHWFERDAKTGKWNDTGMISTAIQEDEGLPPELRQAAALYKQLAPQQDPMMVWAVSMALNSMKKDDPARAGLEGMLKQGVMPDMEDRAEKLRLVIGRLMDEYTKNFARQRGLKIVEEGGATEQAGKEKPTGKVELWRNPATGKLEPKPKK